MQCRPSILCVTARSSARGITQCCRCLSFSAPKQKSLARTNKAGSSLVRGEPQASWQRDGMRDAISFVFVSLFEYAGFAARLTAPCASQVCAGRRLEAFPEQTCSAQGAPTRVSSLPSVPEPCYSSCIQQFDSWCLSLSVGYAATGG